MFYESSLLHEQSRCLLMTPLCGPCFLSGNLQYLRWGLVSRIQSPTEVDNTPGGSEIEKGLKTVALQCGLRPCLPHDLQQCMRGRYVGVLLFVVEAHGNAAMLK